MIAGGDLHEYNWQTPGWTTVDLSAQSIVIDSSAKVDFCVSRGRLIVSDGVNTPWMWDPSGPTYTTLTNAPVADGCEVYYDKVFFFDIPGSENEFQWSDEALPTDGYAGDNQAWEFAQTDTGRLTALAALNTKLVVFKQDSIAEVRGQIDENFATDAVREGISETEGCMAQRSVIVVDSDVYYLSVNGPRVLARGQTVKRLNEDQMGRDMLADIWTNFDRAYWDQSFAVFDANRRHIIWFMPITETTVAGQIRGGLIYAIDENAFSYWVSADGTDYRAAWRAEDHNGDEHVVVGMGTQAVLDYGVGWDDDASAAVERIVRTREIGRETPTVERRMSEAHLMVRPQSDALCRLKTAAISNGSVESATERMHPLLNRDGRRRLRRGFNTVGYTVGMEVKTDKAGEAFYLESALLLMTGVGAHGDS
jgi:hypothetical protein